MSRLAAVSRVVTFDRRGTGLSDQAMASGEGLALPRLAGDVKAVLDAVESRSAVVFGDSLGGMTAIQFALDHPGRTDALVVMGTTAALARHEGFPIGLDPAHVDDWVDGVVRRWGTDAAAQAEAIAPSMHTDARFRSWLTRLERHRARRGWWRHPSDGPRPTTCDRASARCGRRRWSCTGGDDRALGVEHGRYLAHHLPEASYVELAGADHVFFAGDQQEVLDAILAFVDEHVANGALRTTARRAERRNAYGYGWESPTPREREVATLAATGMTKKEVAERLRMSPHTVDGRLRRVFAKLAVSNRAELAAEINRAVR